MPQIIEFNNVKLIPFINFSFFCLLLANIFIFESKIITILGARQVGKSTLIKQLDFNNKKIIWFDGENADVNILFENPNSERLKQIIGQAEIVVFDEAQKIQNIGSILKLFADYHKTFKSLQVVQVLLN